MGLTLLIIAAALVFIAVGAVAARGPIELPDIPRPFGKSALRSFSPRKTLFIIGPSANHPPCRLQRRLLKPAIALLIREDVTVIEIYGKGPARRNGEEIDWLDPSLLRHAMDAEDGFLVAYVDEAGKTVIRRPAPLVAADIFAHAGLSIDQVRSSAVRPSLVLKKLEAA